MLVSHVLHLMEVEGVTDFRDAVERGAHERLVAIVILCGLITSTLLNMIVVPTLYLRYGRQAANA